jgi:hypothetical protein
MLYSSRFVDPPEQVDHYGVELVGQIETDFDDVSDSIVDSRWNERLGRQVYQYNYDLEVRFRSQEGMLTFRSTAYGKERAKTRIICE